MPQERCREPLTGPCTGPDCAPATARRGRAPRCGRPRGRRPSRAVWWLPLLGTARVRPAPRAHAPARARTCGGCWRGVACQAWGWADRRPIGLPRHFSIVSSSGLCCDAYEPICWRPMGLPQPVSRPPVQLPRRGRQSWPQRCIPLSLPWQRATGDPTEATVTGITATPTRIRVGMTRMRGHHSASESFVTPLPHRQPQDLDTPAPGPPGST